MIEKNCIILIAQHPQETEHYFVFAQSNYNKRAMYKISIQNNCTINEEQLITCKEYANGGVPGFLNCARAIDNGFETVTVVNNCMARVQWMFDGTEQVVGSVHPCRTCLQPFAMVNDCYVMIACPEYPSKKTTLEVWDLKLDTFVSHQVPGYGSVQPFDGNRALVMQENSCAAYLYDTTTNELQPYPLFNVMAKNVFAAHVNSNYLLLFSEMNIVLLNKKTRHMKAFKTNTIGLTSGVPVPQVNGAVDMLIGGHNGLYTISFDENEIEFVFPAIATDAEIATAGKSIPVHKLVLAARIPKSTEDTNVLDWSFASKEAAEIVVRFLYSGSIEIDDTTYEEELNEMEQIAQLAELPILQQYVQFIKSGNEYVVNTALNHIAVKKKLPPNTKIDNVSYYHVYNAFLALCENKDVTRKTRLAIEENPNNLEIERLVKNIEQCNANHLTRSYGNLERDMIKLVNNPHMSDLEFKMEKTTLVAHSFFFRFESTFLATMRELNDEPILVIDMAKLDLVCNEEMLRIFLMHAYTGIVSLPSDLTVQSMKSFARLAHFFACVELKNYVEQLLCNHVTKVNAVEWCEFASLNQCTKLLQSVQQYLPGSITTVDKLLFQLSDVTVNSDTMERTMAIAMHFTMMGSAHLSDLLQLIIVPGVASSNGLAMFNYTIPVAHGFEYSMSIASPNIFSDDTSFRCSIVEGVPFSCKQMTNVFTCIISRMHSLAFQCPSHYFSSEQVISFPMQLTFTGIPMKHLDAARNDNLLLVTINNVTHSFAVQYDSNKKYFFVMQAANDTTSARSIQLQTFKAEFTTNEEAWLPMIMNKPITCFRPKCNQVFTLSSSTSCVGHAAYARLENPFSARSDYEFLDSQLIWNCCKNDHGHAGCYKGKHGLTET